MAHPFAKHNAHATSKSRVGHIMKSGGQTHSDAAADKKLFKELMAKHEASEARAEGRKSGGRLDKYARGGRTKGKGKHGTQVNIAVVAPHGRHPADAGATPGGPPPPLGAPPIRPPAGGPPGGLPPGLPPGGPPGLPPGMGPPPPGMMKKGGRVKGFARGGKLGMTAGADTGVGRLQKVKVQKKRGRN